MCCWTGAVRTALAADSVGKAPGLGTAIHGHTLTVSRGGGQNAVIRTSVFTHPGLCGTFCFTCLACQVAADMNECCLCGASVAMRTLYRTRYGIPVNLLQYCIIRICTHIQNNCDKHGGHLMVSVNWIGASQVALVVKKEADAGDVRDMGSIPGWERSPGGGHARRHQLNLVGRSFLVCATWHLRSIIVAVDPLVMWPPSTSLWKP